MWFLCEKVFFVELMELPLDEFLVSLGDSIHNPGVVDEIAKSFPVLIDVNFTKIVDDFDRNN
jgi:hypothetical protein